MHQLAGLVEDVEVVLDAPPGSRTSSYIRDSRRRVLALDAAEDVALGDRHVDQVCIGAVVLVERALERSRRRASGERSWRDVEQREGRRAPGRAIATKAVIGDGPRGASVDQPVARRAASSDSTAPIDREEREPQREGDVPVRAGVREPQVEDEVGAEDGAVLRPSARRSPASWLQRDQPGAERALAGDAPRARTTPASDRQADQLERGSPGRRRTEPPTPAASAPGPPTKALGRTVPTTLTR